nr:MAG TPA: hypothetical protein [Caudoviricetes sp.]
MRCHTSLFNSSAAYGSTLQCVSVTLRYYSLPMHYYAILCFSLTMLSYSVPIPLISNQCNSMTYHCLTSLRLCYTILFNSNAVQRIIT